MRILYRLLMCLLYVGVFLSIIMEPVIFIFLWILTGKDNLTGSIVDYILKKEDEWFGCKIVRQILIEKTIYK